MRYNKTEAKVATFLSAFLGSLLSKTMMYRLRKATERAILFMYVTIVFGLEIKDVEIAF